MKKFINKISTQAGFSLAETLVAVIIILLVSSIVAAGMPAAKDAYVKVIESANAQMLLSTTLTALRDEITTAQLIDVSDTVIHYRNTYSGECELSFDSGNGMFYIQRYLDLEHETDPNLKADKKQPLLSKSAKTDTLLISFPTGEKPFNPKNDNSIDIGAFTVKSTSTKTDVAKLKNPYTINVLTPKKDTSE